VQLRARHDGAPARVIPTGRRARVELRDTQRAVTPGQWAVCYDADGFVLCAGIIADFDAA